MSSCGPLEDVPLDRDALISIYRPMTDIMFVGVRRMDLAMLMIRKRKIMNSRTKIG